MTKLFPSVQELVDRIKAEGAQPYTTVYPDGQTNNSFYGAKRYVGDMYYTRGEVHSHFVPKWFVYAVEFVQGRYIYHLASINNFPIKFKR